MRFLRVKIYAAMLGVYFLLDISNNSMRKIQDCKCQSRVWLFFSGITFEV